MALRFILDLHRATHRIGLHIGRFGPPAVTQGEAHILAHLDASEDSTIGDVHRAFAHKRSTLTSMLDRLERRGFVQRTNDPRDRRTFVIRLTPSGRSLARRVSTYLAAFETRVLEHVSAADLRACQRVLDAIEHASYEPAD